MRKRNCNTTKPCYAETELQYHKALQDTGTHHSVYVRKALAFVRKMLKHISMPHSQVPPLSSIPSQDEKKNDIPADAPSMRWTGKASDLVELIYGVSEMGCINGGEASLKEIAAYFYKVFGVQAKGCYNIFGDIKMRKNESRTYFLDRAAEKVDVIVHLYKNSKARGRVSVSSPVFST